MTMIYPQGKKARTHLVGHNQSRTRMRHVARLTAARLTTAAVAVAAVAGLAGCTTFEKDEIYSSNEVYSLSPDDIDLERAAAANRNRLVQEEYRDRVEVLDDPWGIETVKNFYTKNGSASLIIAENTDSALLRAASLAVAQRVPMVVYDDSVRAQIINAVEELNTGRVLLVGSVPVASFGGDVQVTQDPGTTPAIGRMTAFEFTSRVVDAPENMARAVANLDPNAHVELKAAWEPLQRFPEVEPIPLRAQSRRDSETAPVIIATPETSVASVANVKAYGAAIRMMPTPDPRDSKAQMAQVAGLEDGPLVALGPQFGDEKLLTDRIREGWHADTAAETTTYQNPTDTTDNAS